MNNKIILGMKEAVDCAKANRRKNIRVSAELLIDMAARIDELEEAAENAFYNALEADARSGL